MKGNKMKAEERWIGIKDVSAHLGVNKKLRIPLDRKEGFASSSGWKTFSIQAFRG